MYWYIGSQELDLNLSATLGPAILFAAIFQRQPPCPQPRVKRYEGARQLERLEINERRDERDPTYIARAIPQVLTTTAPHWPAQRRLVGWLHFGPRPE